MSGRARDDVEQGPGTSSSSPRPAASPFTGGAMFSRSMSHLQRAVPSSGEGTLQGSAPEGGNSKRGWSKLRGAARGMSVMAALARARPRPASLSVNEGDEEEQPGAEGDKNDLDAPLLSHNSSRRSLGRNSNSMQSQRSSGTGTGQQRLSGTGECNEPEISGAAVGATMNHYRGVRGRLQRLEQVEQADSGPGRAVVIGSINALVGIPAQTAFATIVFQDALYTPYLGDLCKFFFFASAVHQIVFIFLSTLPYAVGQVQDVGLIFLSSMATSIAAIVTAAGLGATEALATTLLTTCIATFIVGLLTLMVGKFKLAGLVQYVPLPVIGGYLGYVGYFIIAGGAGLVSGVQLDSILNWVDIFTVDRLLKLLPMFASTFLITRSLVFHPAVLPLTLMSIPLMFHGVLLATGTSLAWCQENDWVMKPMPGNQQFWDLWRYFDVHFDQGLTGVFSAVHWPALTAQLGKILGLFLVVSFGSGMDVAAIQQDSPTPLNFNQELVTVGASNMVTALLGAGYTGSYIFSQTIFTMKAGIKNNLSGFVIATVELAVFALPFSVVQYVPKFFFGALLLWFGVEIVKDWLFESVKKLSKPEYVLLWLTFLAIMWSGLELGIAAGIVMVTLVFAYEYAQSTVSSLNPCAVSSATVYSYSHMSLLELMLPRRVVGLSLSGFLFFGNSISISDRIEQIALQMIQRAEAEVSENDQLETLFSQNLSDPLSRASTAPPASPLTTAGSLDDAEAKRRSFARIVKGSGLSEVSRGGRRMAAAAMEKVTLNQMADAPFFIILDFRLVPRLDSTGAKTFATLAMKLQSRDIQVLICGLPADKNHRIRQLLRAHSLRTVERAGPASVSPDLAYFAVPDSPGHDDDEDERQLGPGEVWEFPSIELASKFCEDDILDLAAERKLVDSTENAVALEDVLRMHVESMPHAHVDPLAALLKRYMTTINLKRGQVLFRQGDAMAGLYIVESGKLHLFMPAPCTPSSWGGAPPAGSLPSVAGLEHQPSTASGSGEQEQGRAVEHGPGSLVCPHDFALRRPYSATARCSTTAARVMLLPIESFERLMSDAPAALNALQVALTRSLSLDLTSSLGLADSNRANSNIAMSFRGLPRA